MTATKSSDPSPSNGMMELDTHASSILPAPSGLTPPHLPWNTTKTMADDESFWNKHPDDNQSRAHKETTNGIRDSYSTGRNDSPGEGR